MEAHEYQDAYGFVQVAKAIAEDLDAGGDPRAAPALQQARDALAGLDVAWPELPQPNGRLETDASLLLDAASVIEEAADGID